MAKLPKKSEGLTLNIVVMAALALFVLIILVIIIGDKMRPAADFYSKCGSPPLNGEVMPNIDYEEDTPCKEGYEEYTPLTTVEISKTDNNKKVITKCCVRKFA